MNSGTSGGCGRFGECEKQELVGMKDDKVGSRQDLVTCRLKWPCA